MKLKVQSIHFDADQVLLDFIQLKMNKLKQYFDGILTGEVFLRLEKNKIADNKVVEIKLHIPGNELFVKEQCKTFEEATDLAVESLTRQITKHKEKMRRE